MQISRIFYNSSVFIATKQCSNSFFSIVELKRFNESKFTYYSSFFLFLTFFYYSFDKFDKILLHKVSNVKFNYFFWIDDNWNSLDCWFFYNYQLSLITDKIANYHQALADSFLVTTLFKSQRFSFLEVSI